MYKEDLVLNNLQWLICHKTKPNQTMNLTTQIVKENMSKVGSVNPQLNIYLSEKFNPKYI